MVFTLKIFVIVCREDDPSKNTALKMIQAGLAVRVSRRSIRGRPVVLNPYSDEYLGSWLRGEIETSGLLVVDASWRRLTSERFRGVPGIHVKLPPLLPGNPVNYGKPCILSSIEATAASLYIAGYRELYSQLLGLYKWMTTFHELNKELLEDYAKASTPSELVETILEYWETINPCYSPELLRE